MNKSKSEYVEWFVDIVGNYSQLPKTKIDISLPFLQLGLSSLDVVQVIQDYKKWCGQDLSPTVFFEYSTIDDLSSYLASSQPEKKYTEEKNVSYSQEPIAIIGMSCRFPGAKDKDHFWNLLKDGHSAISELSESRINKKLPFKAYAGLIDEVKEFDKEHFSLSSTEVVHMDPQQRLLLELSWEAFEDSGLTTSSLSGTKTGVYVGISSHDYALEMSKHNDEGHFFDGPGMANSIAANRISYLYNLKGPSYAVDTACSSSLVALHMACVDLRLNTTDMALAGGVNLILSHYLMESFKRAQMLSEDGKCKAFSDDANGYVRAEGGGFLLLKKLSHAIRDKDQIHAVIRGSAINQDGKTNTITAPNGLAQREVIQDAINQSGINAEDITYIETHGTGTPLGDPVEYAALRKVFEKNEQIYIGSVKTNIGHTEAAAGIAGVIKTILALKNSLIPQNLNFSKLNTNITSQLDSIIIPQKLTNWNKIDNKNRIAGVSSFGFGGTNAHIILEEAPSNIITLENFSLESPRPSNLFILSASNNTSLKKTVAEYLNFINHNSHLNIVDLCANLYQHRSILPAKLALVVKDLADLKNNLESFVQDRKIHGHNTYLPTKTQTKLALVFATNNLPCNKVSKELYEYFSTFREGFNNCIKKIQPFFSQDLFTVWLNDSTVDVKATHALKFCFEYSFVKLLSSFNTSPFCVVGYNLQGESYLNNILVELQRDKLENLSAHYTYEVMLQKSPTHILEIGANAFSTNSHKDNEISYISFEENLPSYLDSFLQVLSQLYCQNFPLSYKELIKNISYKNINLPLTQYDKKLFWLKEENTAKTEQSTIENTNDVSVYLNEIIQILSRELNIDYKNINPKEELLNLGADSLVMMNCLDIINEKYDSKIGVSDLFQKLNNVEKIAEYLKNMNCSNKVSAKKEIPTVQEVSNPLSSIGSGKGVLGNFLSKHVSTVDTIEEKKKKEYLEKLIEKFTLKISKSKDHTQKYRQSLADNRASAGFRPNLKEMVYPIVFKNARGSHFEDIDGNTYLDFTMGFGVNLFGHSPTFIQDALKLQLEEGVAVGPQSFLAGIVAEKFKLLTKMDRVAFVNSGTEAIMTAVRLARAATKRTKIVIFEGSYHGHFDGILARRNTIGDSVPVAPGIVNSLINDVIVLEYGSSDAINYIKTHGDEIAAVMVEPVQSRFPELQPKQFLLELRKVTTETGSAFIFDEVITGFRIAVGGAQEYFGVKADIATYGKILGGGMPIGAVAGSSLYMDFIDGGNWNFGDSSFPKNDLTFFAGTFCKHPFAMAASLEVLSKLENEGKDLLSNLNLKTTQLCQELNQFFKAQNIALELVNFGTLFRFKYQANMDWLFFALNLEGIYIWEGRNMFLSSAHTHDDISFFSQKVKKVIKDLLDVGYLPLVSIESNNTHQRSMIDSHRRFLDLTLSSSVEDHLSSQIYLSVRFRGTLNEDAMVKSLETLVERYDSFQAEYDLKNKNISFGFKKKIHIGQIDLSSLPDADTHLENWIEKNSKIVLDLKKQPLKIDLIKIHDTDYILSLVVHHLVMDGLSIAFMTDDLSKIYNGLTSNKNFNLKPIYSFSDYLQDHENKISSMQESANFWKVESKKWQKLDVGENANRIGSREKILLQNEDYKKIQSFGYKHKSSLLVTSLTALQEVLTKTFKKRSFTVGVPAAGHTSIKDPMVGNCVNLAPLTLDFPLNEPLPERISKLRQHQLEVFKHSDYPIERVLDDKTLAPISIIFNVEPISKLPEFIGVKTQLLTYPIHASEFPLMFNLMKLDNELHIEMDYQFTLFNTEEARNFLLAFKNALLQNE